MVPTSATQQRNSQTDGKNSAGMKRLFFLVLAVAIVVGVVISAFPPSGHADGVAAPVFLTQIPPGYRNWKWISSAHEEGNLHSIGAVLGNDIAVKAYRAGTIPFPDGTMIAALHYQHVPSVENDKIFGQAQSFVPGTQTNIQFMVKDSTKYAATGGWGFGFFINGKSVDAAKMTSCFPCHAQEKTRDLVFTRYAP